MAKPIVISVLADAAGVGRGVNEAEGYLGRLGSKAAAVAKVVGVAVVAAGVAVAVSSVKAASEAEQSIGATQSIYGEYADSVISKSKEAAGAVGLSANEYRELGTVMGAMLKNAGTPMDQLAGKTDQLITLGSDLAATFGGTTAEAVSAVSSLMRGEADPIERYGVSIKQSDVNARLAAQGLTGLAGQALKTAEAEARLGLLFEQTGDAAGQFGRESGTLAGQQQRLTAYIDNMKVALGNRLLPVATTVFGYLNQYGPVVFAALERGFDAMAPTIAAVAAGLSDFAGGAVTSLGPVLAAAVPFIVSTVTALAGFSAELVSRLMPAVSTVLGWVGEFGPPAFAMLSGAVSALSPVIGALAGVALGLGSALSGVIKFADKNRAVIATLVGGYVAYRAILLTTTAAGWAMYLWQSRAVIMGAAQAAATKGMAAAQLLLNTAMKANPLGLLIAGITLAVGAVILLWKNSETFRSVVTGAFSAVVSAGQALWSGIQTAFSAIGDAIGFYVGMVKGYINMWVAAFGLLVDGAMWVWGGIQAAFSAVGDAIGFYVGLVRGYINLWVGAFQWVVDAGWRLVGGIGSALGSVGAKVGEVKDKVTGALSGAASWLKDAGGKIIDGLVSGIGASFNKVKNKLGELTGKLTSWKGPAERDRKLLRPVGRLIIGGLVAGFNDEETTVMRSLGGLTDRIGDMAAQPLDLTPRFDLSGDVKAKPSFMASWSDGGLGNGSATTIHNHYDIKVEAITPNAEVGRAVVDAIRDFERIGGSVPNARP